MAGLGGTSDPEREVPLLSILIPTLNEEERIGGCLERAREVAPGAQIIVSDGGSRDRTVERAASFAQVVQGPRGRGRQLNRAAALATGEVLLFLHADTLLPRCIVEAEIRRALARPDVIGGNFRLRFEPASLEARLLETGSILLRRLGIFYGDSAIFVRREPFLQRGGFREEDLMEDVELVRWMRRSGRTIQIPYAVTTSSRRFRGKALWHLLLWATLQALYACGVPTCLLARFYPPPDPATG